MGNGGLGGSWAWGVGVEGGRRRSSQEKIELKTDKDSERSQSLMRTRKQEGSTEWDPDIL